MALGRQAGFIRMAENAPRRGPQSFITGLLHGDVFGWTEGSPRAAILSVIPKRTHTYFGPYKPGTAQRIPPMINTGYGPDYASDERVRRTLVARALMFRSSLIAQGAVPTVQLADAAESQAANAARQAG